MSALRLDLRFSRNGVLTTFVASGQPNGQLPALMLWVASRSRS
jgi:hypothetical protein